MAENDVTIVSGNDSIARCVLEDTSSGAPKEKFFCSGCGSTLWTVPGVLKGKFLMVRASVLDNWTKLQPAAEIFVKYRPTWATPVAGASQWQEARH